MSKLPRVTAKVFASNAAETDIGQYGSALTGAKINTGDIAQIQALPAYETGWRGAVISERNYPTLQEMNGLQKVFSQQIAYLFQNGAFAEWDENTEYCANTSFCQINGVLYQSLTNNNIGNNPSNDETNWKKIDLGGGGGGDTGSGFSLFDVVEKDHILSFEESMGFGLLGTYVYKEPVAGSRYGYPDFYNECVAQKSTEGNTLLALKNNVEIVGSPVVNNGVLSGFSTSNYVKLPQIFNPGSSTWEIVIPFSVDNFDTEQSIFMSCIEGSNTNRYLLLAVEPNTGEIRCYYNYEQTNWQTTGSFGAENTISAGKKYWVKVEYDGTHLKGSLSTDGDDYTLCLNEEIAAPATASTNNITTLGLYAANEKTLPLNGSIDLKECYIKIDNELWWSGATTATKNPNGHIFYDIADKATVDEIFSQRGEAWFYGVDTENERIFLPRGTRSQYTINTDETGDYVEAGLPNIAAKDSIGFSDDNPTSDLPPFVFDRVVGNSSGGPSGEKRFKFDASTVNTIYGNSDTVQPYATKKLLYIVVGNVKVQSAASDVVDVTTTENDTVPLFTGQYFNFKPNNPSWLKAGEQQDSGGIYTSCYNKLVQALTDNIWEIKVIDSTAMEEGVDYSEYWIVYQDTMRFRTPLTACKEIMPGNEITSSLGFSSNPTNTVESYTVPYNAYITIIGYKTSTSNTLTVKLNGAIVSQTRALTTGQSSESYFFARKGDIVTVSTDSASTGWVIATQTITKATASGELYFKVANAVENLEILNVGQVMEELSNKVNVSATNWATNACMPDYTAGIAVTSSPFTAPRNGFIQSINATGGNMSIDGASVATFATSPFICQYGIAKGSIFTFNKGVLTFYPAKGAN